MCPILSSPLHICLSTKSYSDHHQICSPKPKKKKKNPCQRTCPILQSQNSHPSQSQAFKAPKSTAIPTSPPQNPSKTPYHKILNTLTTTIYNPFSLHAPKKSPLRGPPQSTAANLHKFHWNPTNKKSHHHQIKSIKTSEPTVAENHQHPDTQPQTSAADPRSCQAHNTLHAAVTPPYHLIQGWRCHFNLMPPLQSDTTSTPIQDISLLCSSLPLVLLLTSSLFLSGCFTVRCCLLKPNKFITCFLFSSQKKKKKKLEEGKVQKQCCATSPFQYLAFALPAAHRPSLFFWLTVHTEQKVLFNF